MQHHHLFKATFHGGYTKMIQNVGYIFWNQPLNYLKLP